MDAAQKADTEEGQLLDVLLNSASQLEKAYAAKRLATLIIDRDVQLSALVKDFEVLRGQHGQVIEFRRAVAALALESMNKGDVVVTIAGTRPLGGVVGGPRLVLCPTEPSADHPAGSHWFPNLPREGGRK